jgi:hypothetical protein
VEHWNTFGTPVLGLFEAFKDRGRKDRSHKFTLSDSRFEERFWLHQYYPGLSCYLVWFGGYFFSSVLLPFYLTRLLNLGAQASCKDRAAIYMLYI